MSHTPENHRAIIVCTDKRGVFFGYVDNDGPSNTDFLKDDATVTMKKSRMAVYWTSTEKGVFGLAAKGPSEQCRIGPATDIVVKGVHAVFPIEDESVIDRWEAAPWG